MTDDLTTSAPVSDLLTDKLRNVSNGPGVYQMKDVDEKIIYVGKAKSLKKRLSNYFARKDHPDIKTGILVSKIVDFETIVTATENEALILESTLIKRHNPRYNVILKDGKQYPCLRLDIKEEYPSLTLVRNIKKDGAVYFGPYSSGSAVRQSMDFVNKTFKLRKCKTPQFMNRSRPCLNFQMGACLGVCCNAVSRDEYMDAIRDVILFLKGRTPHLLRRLKEKMSEAASREDFEKAAEFRDKMFALEKILEKQVVVASDLRNRDVIGFCRKPNHALVTLLFVRGGQLVGSRHFQFSDPAEADAELISSFLSQHYADNHFIPREILVPVLSDGIPVVAERLSDIRGLKVHVLCPQRGEKKRMVEMAMENATKTLTERLDKLTAELAILDRLRIRLGMTAVPRRIECFDNSNLSGTTPVSAMVVFKDGKPDKSAYRKYILQPDTGSDDYGAMAEVIRRRYEKEPDDGTWPDLLLIDGGKGQLNMTMSVLVDLGLRNRFYVASIAKKDEHNGETEDKIYLPGRSNPVNFGREGELLYLLERVRDEAHRFVISFQRQKRGKQAVRSSLDGIPGIGPKRKAALLRHFKTVEGIMAAGTEDIAAVKGMSHAAAVSLKNSLTVLKI